VRIIKRKRKNPQNYLERFTNSLAKTTRTQIQKPRRISQVTAKKYPYLSQQKRVRETNKQKKCKKTWKKKLTIKDRKKDTKG